MIRCIQLLARGATGSGTGTRTTLAEKKKSAIFVCEASSEHGVSGTGAQHSTAHNRRGRQTGARSVILKAEAVGL
jgi:hypothetical protein